MNRRDLFRLAKTSAAAFLVARYGAPEPARVSWEYDGGKVKVTVRDHQEEQVLWAANYYGLTPAQAEALKSGKALAS